MFYDKDTHPLVHSGGGLNLIQEEVEAGPSCKCGICASLPGSVLQEERLHDAATLTLPVSFIILHLIKISKDMPGAFLNLSHIGQSIIFTGRFS